MKKTFIRWKGIAKVLLELKKWERKERERERDEKKKPAFQLFLLFSLSKKFLSAFPCSSPLLDKRIRVSLFNIIHTCLYATSFLSTATETFFFDTLILTIFESENFSVDRIILPPEANEREKFWRLENLISTKLWLIAHLNLGIKRFILVPFSFNKHHSIFVG